MNFDKSDRALVSKDHPHDESNVLNQDWHLKEKLENWEAVAGFIHNKVDTFDGDCDDRSDLLVEIGRVIDMAFGDMPSAMNYISE